MEEFRALVLTEASELLAFYDLELSMCEVGDGQVVIGLVECSHRHEWL